MISNIYNKLFTYGDKLAKEGRNDERRVVQRCESLVHDAYMEGVIDRKKIEGELSSLDGLDVYVDKNDGQEYYELDNRHFDSMEEVVLYLIDFYNHAAQYKKGHSLEMTREQRRRANEFANGNRQSSNKH